MKTENTEKKFDELGGVKPVRGQIFSPLEEDEILKIEKIVGANLPEPYRSLLAKFGSWSFEEFISFPYSNVTMMQVMKGQSFDLNKRNFLAYMYGSKEDDTYSLERAIKTYKERMPETIIPIGDDGGGNKVCLGLNGAEKGKVFYWDHDSEWDEDDYLEEEGEPMPPEVKFQNVYLVANSFEEFLNQLRVEEI